MNARLNSFFIVLAAFMLGVIYTSFIVWNHSEKVCSYVRYQGAQTDTLECWRELH